MKIDKASCDFVYHINIRYKDHKPSVANRKIKIATSGEISIIPNGGIILLNGSKYGSQIFAKNCPIVVSRALGNHDIKI